MTVVADDLYSRVFGEAYPELAIPESELRDAHQQILGDNVPILSGSRSRHANGSYQEFVGEWPEQRFVVGIHDQPTILEGRPSMFLKYIDLKFAVEGLKGALRAPATGLGYAAGALTDRQAEGGFTTVIGLKYPTVASLNAVFENMEEPARFRAYDGDRFKETERAEAMREGEALVSVGGEELHDITFHDIVLGMLPKAVFDKLAEKAAYDLEVGFVNKSYMSVGNGFPLAHTMEDSITAARLKIFSSAYSDYLDGKTAAFSRLDLGKTLAYWLERPNYRPQDIAMELVDATFEHLDRLAELAISS